MENVSNTDSLAYEKLSFERFRDEVLKDYRIACESREASLLGRKEVLTGKAKFGIFGDGKEVAQIAVAKCEFICRPELCGSFSVSGSAYSCEKNSSIVAWPLAKARV